jgi:hypothetical protein
VKYKSISFLPAPSYLPLTLIIEVIGLIQNGFMTETKLNSSIRRGRIFPEIQWTEAQKKEWKSEREAFARRCKLIFEQLQPQLIKTHYNWYVAVEPDSGEYFLAKDALLAAQKAHETHMFNNMRFFSCVAGILP